MRPIACAVGLALLAVACTAVEKKEDPAATDSAAAAAAAVTEKKEDPAATDSAAAAAAAVTAGPLMVPGAPARAGSTKAGAKAAPKKSASRNPTADSERDSATEPIFEVDADGKVTRIKK